MIAKNWLVGLLVGFTLTFFQCGPTNIDYKSLAPYSSEGAIQAVIEIPAGTNDKLEFNAETGSFEQDMIGETPRVVEFLPYPGNYGFIPGTSMDKSGGGDGDALDILVIGASQPTGTLLEVQPIAILKLLDGGEEDHKIIAIPTNTADQIIKSNNFMDFLITYDAAKKIIEDWFLNYKGLGAVELIGWENEQNALNEIKNRAVN